MWHEILGSITDINAVLKITLFKWNDFNLNGWKIIGFAGVGMFSARWLVQMRKSAQAGRVVMPKMFWHLSLVGSLLTLAYFACYRMDLVGVLGNLFPAVVAGFNLFYHKKGEQETARQQKANGQ